MKNKLPSNKFKEMIMVTVKKCREKNNIIDLFLGHLHANTSREGLWVSKKSYQCYAWMDGSSCSCFFEEKMQINGTNFWLTFVPGK